VVHCRASNPLSRARVTPALLVFTVALGGAPQRAHAGDDNHIGNGQGNRNAVSIHRPDFSTGAQHISNQNIGGWNATQNSFCKKKVKHCHIVERIGWAP
jgi:hypothetical protein